MADWYLNRALTNWRIAVNAAYPNRDKTSDGTVGDYEHSQTNSDHNPDADGSVDAWDMDVDLRSGGDNAAEIERLKKVFQSHPAARYWIHNRQIAHRSTGWKREYYSGPSPHDHHVHWNSEPTQENSSLPWVIEGVDMPLSKDDLKAVGLTVATWDYENGDGVEAAYEVALRAADNAVAANKNAADVKAAVAGLKADIAAIKAAVTNAVVPINVTLDPATPAVAEAIAEAVASEVARRMAE